MKENWNKIFKNGRVFYLIKEEFLLELLDFVKKERKGKDIKNALDLGCGIGDLVIKLAKNGIKTAGVDFSDVALSIAKKEAERQGASNLVEFIELDLNELNKFNKEEKYDIIFNKLTYAFIAKRSEFLKNVNELLSEDGIFILMTPVLIEGKEYNDKLKNISVKKEEVENALKKEFGDFKIYNERSFDDNGFEITYICNKN